MGFPPTVAIVGNWQRMQGRGLTTGIWFSNVFVGSIIGSLVAGAVVDYAWGWSFLIPAVIIVATGAVTFFFCPARMLVIYNRILEVLAVSLLI